MIKVFVYGTLMRGRINHSYYLSKSKFLGEAELVGYAMYCVSSFPGIVTEQSEKVKGEVYCVDEKTLRKLDNLEGEGSLYIRKMVDLQLNNETIQGFVYIWNHTITGVQKISYALQPWKRGV
ncbi:MAG TPA: gamma-glutamylcyclotransferase family protein [Clostridium sp.]|uniref:gamma-glutamylcyclotransferase family protein n=1 Tax=Clostridium sp. TaxID=1506 RepID=UPI002F94684A